MYSSYNVMHTRWLPVLKWQFSSEIASLQALHETNNSNKHNMLRTPTGGGKPVGYLQEERVIEDQSNFEITGEN